MAHRAEFTDGQAIGMLDGAPADLHSLDEVTLFLQHYLDCEVALVSFADAPGACARRQGAADGEGAISLANPLAARAHGMQFYAGLPLRDDAGRCIGTMAAMDGAERPLSGEQLQMMRRLAGIAVHLCGPTRHD
ncbi:GAF domain-containing protein [Croceibacterium sp. TMG7-5b_MA50]|uniref:GAF domain-containing protein n=1 Tax=Croceibacterium sp. TMG7-5b_MA50 TaxID=3121290 RepID=UPI003221959F